MSVLTQQSAPSSLASADSPETSETSPEAPSAAPPPTPTDISADREPFVQALSHQRHESPHPHRAPHERMARVAAVVLLAVVCVAVVWPSGHDVAELKDSLGPAFLSAEGKDVILNLVMLAPATFCAVAGWRDVPWWMWALVGCVVGLSAEVLQSLLPMLERRPSLANVGQNAVGAWAGALAAWYLLRRLHPRSTSA